MELNNNKRTTPEVRYLSVLVESHQARSLLLGLAQVFFYIILGLLDRRNLLRILVGDLQFILLF